MQVTGLVTLRAFDRLAYYKKDYVNNLDKVSNTTFCFAMTSRWLGTRFDMISCGFVTFTCMLFIYTKDSTPPELATVCLQLSSSLCLICRLWWECMLNYNKWWLVHNAWFSILNLNLRMIWGKRKIQIWRRKSGLFWAKLISIRFLWGIDLNLNLLSDNWIVTSNQACA